jgi:hypothetical protein
MPRSAHDRGFSKSSITQDVRGTRPKFGNLALHCDPTNASLALSAVGEWSTAGSGIAKVIFFYTGFA